MQKRKNTVVGMNFIKYLAQQGYRIFDINEARSKGEEVGIKPTYMKECLSILKQHGWIETVRPGLYAICSELLSGSSVSEYEIAMKLVEPATICCWSAMHYHQITQQIPHQIFVLTTLGSRLPYAAGHHGQEVTLRGVRYHFLRIKKEHFFGIKKVWVGEARVNITDLEKTLLDGLSRPKYCGGFGEVLESFKIASDKIDLHKIIDYAKKMGPSATRRVGWTLDYLEIPPELTKELESDYNGYINLNSSGTNAGKFNKKWGVRENI
jgi:predicted transcriptional regulator of viral defense system